mgnify:CR=1 FL=1
MPYKRLIARLDVKGGNVVKGINFEGLKVVGKAKEMAERYAEAGADEILYLDVTASLYGRNQLESLLEKTVESLTISAEKVEKIVDAAIAASKSAWEDAYAAAKVAKKEGTDASLILSEAKQNSIDKFQIDVDAKLSGSGTDYRDLSSLVDNVKSGIADTKAFIEGKEGLAQLSSALDFATEAAGHADDTAAYAQETMAALTPEAVLEKAELALSAATQPRPFRKVLMRR